MAAVKSARSTTVSGIVVLCGVALVACGSTERDATATFAPSPNATLSFDEGLYRYGYRGGIKAGGESKVRWLDDGTGFEMTTGGSGQCLNEPIELEVVAADHLRITTELQDDPQGCQESLVLSTFVMDLPAGIDPSQLVRFQFNSAGSSGTSSIFLEPRI